MVQFLINLSIVLFHLTPLSFVFVAWMVIRSPQKIVVAPLWGLFCILVAFAWTGAIFATFHVSLTTAEIIACIAMMLASLGTWVYYLFVLSHLQLLATRRKELVVLLGYELLLLYLFLTTDLVYGGVEQVSPTIIQPKPGRLISLYLFYILYIFVSAIVLSYRHFQKSHGQKRLQYRYFFFGTIVIFMSAIGSMLPFSPSTSFLVWIPSCLTIAYPILISYAIVHHRLWDIRTVVHKTLFWIVVSAFSVTPLYFLLSYLQPILQRHSAWLLAVILVFYFLMILFARNFQPRIDQFFDRRFYSQRYILDNFIKETRHLQDFRALAHSLDRTLQLKLHVATTRIWLRRNAETPWENLLDTQPATKTPPTPDLPPWLDHWLVQHDQALDVSSVEGDHASSTQKQEFLDFMDSRQTTILLPLTHRSHLFGLLELGEKSNLAPYTVEDFEQLERLRDAVEVAFHNALLFQELQQKTDALHEMNMQLEQRVEERTQDLATAKQEVEQAYRQLQQIMQARTRFFNNVTHELRTPLTLLLAPLEDTLLQLQGLPASITQTLEVMHRQAHHLLHLINELLARAEQESYRDKFHIQSVHLDQDLCIISRGFEPLASRKNISFVVDIEKNLPTIYGDQEQLERLFVNLLSNAFKFTEHGQITVRCYQDPTDLICEVTDTGIGIPPEDRERIFGRFTRASNIKDKNMPGSGLGLAIIQDIVQQHGGSIEVESTPDVGSLFRVRLRKGWEHLSGVSMVYDSQATLFFPLPFPTPEDTSEQGHPISEHSASSASNELPPDTPSHNALDKLSENFLSDGSESSVESLIPDTPLPAPTQSSETLALRHQVMIVEDHPDMMRYLQNLLSTQYDVLTAHHGLEALDLLKRVHPALIISDVMMPHLDGHALCQRLKSSPETAAIPILLLTAQKGIEPTLQGFHAGADDYITKPFRSKEILARVRVHLKIKELTQQIALQEKIALLGLLSAGLAHEVKNPAGAILHAVAPLRNMTQDTAPDVKQDIVELLDVVYESAERITSLSNSLLDLASTSHTSYAPWDIQRAIDASLRILQATYPKAKDIHVSLQHESLIEGIRAELNQITINLLSNALKATEHQGEVWLTTSSDASHFALTVKDSGVGIAPEHLPKIFEPLFTTADVGKGTGLGLYLCRNMVRRHRGEIFVQSELGVGTTFRVVFPLPPHEQT